MKKIQIITIIVCVIAIVPVIGLSFWLPISTYFDLFWTPSSKIMWPIGIVVGAAWFFMPMLIAECRRRLDVEMESVRLQLIFWKMIKKQLRNG